MKAKLTEAELNHLLNFIGYGQLNALIWFLGMEEGTSGSEDGLADNIQQRLSLKPVEDLAVAQQTLFRSDITTVRSSPTQVWTWMAKIALALENGEAMTPLDYIRTKLGRKNGNTLLMELLPLPAPRNNEWPDIYETLTPYPNRSAYIEAVLSRRQNMLRQLMMLHHPAYVIAYGSGYRDYYKNVVTIEKWERLGTRGNIEIGIWNKTIMAVTPFFGMGGLRTSDVQIMIERLKLERDKRGKA